MQSVLRRDNLRIPSVPAGVGRLLEVLADEDIPMPKLAMELENFPTICARLISLANSAWASTQVPVATVEGACKHLGFNVVKNTSIGLAVSAPFDPSRCPAFDALRFWHDALACAESVNTLSAVAGSTMPVEIPPVRTAGVLHNLGLLLLVDSLPQETGEALKEVADNPELNLHERLELHCGMDYSQAAELLFSAWNLPQSLVEIVGQQTHPDYQGDYQQEVAWLRLARALVADMSHRLNQEQLLALPRPQGLSAEDLEVVRERLKPKSHKLKQLAASLF